MIRTVCILLLLLPLSVVSQNKAPEITMLTAVADTIGEKMVITYDLADKENDAVNVDIFIEWFGQLRRIENTKGDIGFPVKPGKGKRITLDYDKFTDVVNSRIKLVVDDRQKVSIQDVVGSVDSARIRKYLEFVNGYRFFGSKEGLSHLIKVKKFITDELGNLGLDTARQRFPHKGYVGENLIGEIAGQHEKAVVYIVGAHYDCVDKSDGADDNGSGVAGLLEAARVLSAYKFKNTIRFVGFDLEEEGWIGSKNYVFNGGLSETQTVGGAINFDMIGYSSDKPNSQIIPDGFEILFPDVVKEVAANQYKGNFAINTFNKNSEALSKSFVTQSALYVPDLKVISLGVHGNGELTPQLAASDHVSFWRKGLNALHVGDGGESRNTNLDTPTDKINTINFKFMTNIVKATVATMAELGGICNATSRICKINFNSLQTQ